MEGLTFWRAGEALITLTDIKPLLASWDAKTHPNQVRLQAYLDDIQQRNLSPGCASRSSSGWVAASICC